MVLRRKTEGAVQQGPEVARFLIGLSAEEKGKEVLQTENLTESLFNSRHPPHSIDGESCGSRCPWEDTMRIIKEDHFRETYTRGNGVVGMDRWTEQRRHFNLVKRTHQVLHLNGLGAHKHEMSKASDFKIHILQDQDATNASPGTFVLWKSRDANDDTKTDYVVDSYTDYTSNSNTIPYDQYMEDNEDHVVQRDVSSVRNDALMSILDEMHEQGIQSRLTNKPDMLMNGLSWTSETCKDIRNCRRNMKKTEKFE
ncbi:hypothetical protein Tco_0268727 [Tanacetum coccineum]